MAPIIDELAKKAENEQLSYMNFLLQLFEQEAYYPEKHAKERLPKTAQLPSNAI